MATKALRYIFWLSILARGLPNALSYRAPGPAPGPAPAPAPAPETNAPDCRGPEACGRNPFQLPNGIIGGVGPVIPQSALDLRKAVNASTDGRGGLCGPKSVTPETMELGIDSEGRSCEATCECCSAEGICGCGDGFCSTGCQSKFTSYCGAQF